MARLEVGVKAPDFTLINHHGARVALREWAGQRLVVYFYPADDTPGCTTQACQFNDELDHFAQLGVAVLGVSPDRADRHVAFRSKYGLRFDLLSDPDHQVMTRYGAYGNKVLYGKNVVGVIRSTFVIGATGLIEQALYGVRTNGHAARVLRSLEG